MSTPHIVSSRTVLVWGASPGSSTPLYRATGSITDVGGGAASDLRLIVRDWLNLQFASRNCVAAYSEDCETYGHHPSNAGLYEPYHISAAGAIVLVLPNSSSLGVNTWEVTLLCEDSSLTGHPEHLEKAIFVCPQSLWDFLRSFFASGLDDPMKHIMSPVTELGPANSFLARWISRAAHRTFLRASRPVPKAPPFHLAVYPDNIVWNPKTPQGQNVIDDLLMDLQNEVESVL